jgi:adenylate cyclase
VPATAARAVAKSLARAPDRRLTDVFAIQTDVALRIADALSAELSVDERTRIRREPTHDLQAYQLYLQGRHCLVRYTAEGMRKAIWYCGVRDQGFVSVHRNCGHIRASMRC